MIVSPQPQPLPSLTPAFATALRGAAALTLVATDPATNPATDPADALTVVPHLVRARTADTPSGAIILLPPIIGASPLIAALAPAVSLPPNPMWRDTIVRIILDRQHSRDAPDDCRLIMPPQPRRLLDVALALGIADHRVATAAFAAAWAGYGVLSTLDAADPADAIIRFLAQVDGLDAITARHHLFDHLDLVVAPTPSRHPAAPPASPYAWLPIDDDLRHALHTVGSDCWAHLLRARFVADAQPAFLAGE